MKSPKTLLTEIVNLIEGDLEQMQDRDTTRLDVRDAAKVTRYSKALLEILDHEANERKEQKRRLSSLGDEELKELAKKAFADTK